MRIIAGTLGGRTLRAPRGQDTRPTGGRVREALFNILGPPPDGARILDLFAGAGALGIEALSRGAVSCTFVERAAPAADVIQANLDALGLGHATQLFRIPVAAAITRLDGKGAFDWIFVDPPYATDDAKQTLAAIDASALLATEGVLIIEHDRRRPPDVKQPKTLALADRRRYGDTELSFYRHRQPPEETT